MRDNTPDLFVCFLGIQTSFVLAGLAQERIMSVGYGGEHFVNTASLIFASRFVGFTVALWRLFHRGGLTVAATDDQAQPCRSLFVSRREIGAFCLCSLSSLTNSVSSLCQYGALRVGISFPLVCLFKSSRTIPLLVIGSVFFGRQHSREDCAIAIAIAAGVSLSMLSSSPSGSFSSSSSLLSSSSWSASSLFSGSLLLCVYSVTDAITSLWQSRIFKTHGPSLDPALMQCGVNLWSLVFLSLRLFFGGWRARLPRVIAQSVDDLPPLSRSTSVFAFAARHPIVLLHGFCLVMCSAVAGQFWIYRTLQRHGPLALSCSMVIRQQLSILASFLVFGTRGREEVIGLPCLVGFALVFGALWFKVARASLSSSASTPASAKLAKAVGVSPGKRV